MFNPVSGPVSPIEAIGDTPVIPELGGKGVDETIPFDTGSYHPDDMAMEALANRLVLYQDTLQRGEYHIDFKGHASRLSGEEYNQKLSLQRAQAVKGRLAFLLGLAMGNLDFEFDSDLIHIDGYGEERARDKEKKPPDDNSQSDRVVEVVFEVR
jgi:outer membrane protein OmpA-like peptidoglycan-associated protein